MESIYNYLILHKFYPISQTDSIFKLLFFSLLKISLNYNEEHALPQPLITLSFLVLVALSLKRPKHVHNCELAALCAPKRDNLCANVQ